MRQSIASLRRSLLNKLGGGRRLARLFVDRAALIRAAVESLETRRLFSFQLNVAFEFGAATSAPGYEADSGSPYFAHSSGLFRSLTTSAEIWK